MYTPVKCCGSNVTNYTEGLQGCIYGSMRDPKILENLRHSFPSQDLLVASCDGSYRPLSRTEDRGEASQPFIIAPKKPVPVL
jgi:hypothetical protein